MMQNKICAQCGKRFGCGSTQELQQCWCMELPKVLSPVHTTSDCLCEECLKKMIENKLCKSYNKPTT